MSTPPIPVEVLIETVASYRAHFDNQVATAASLGIARQTLQNRLRRAAERGLLGPQEALPGYAIKSIASKADDGQTDVGGEKAPKAVQFIVWTKGEGGGRYKPVSIGTTRLGGLDPGQGIDLRGSATDRRCECFMEPEADHGRKPDQHGQEQEAAAVEW